jgi:hypothetical protein
MGAKARRAKKKPWKPAKAKRRRKRRRTRVIAAGEVYWGTRNDFKGMLDGNAEYLLTDPLDSLATLSATFKTCAK